MPVGFKACSICPATTPALWRHRGIDGQNQFVAQAQQRRRIIVPSPGQQRGAPADSLGQWLGGAGFGKQPELFMIPVGRGEKRIVDNCIELLGLALPCHKAMTHVLLGLFRSARSVVMAPAFHRHRE
jgi:hypothetical protein